LAVQHPKIAQQAAAAFGEYARFLSDFPTDTIQTILPNFHQLDFRILQFQNLLEVGKVDEKRLAKADKTLQLNEKYLSIFKNLNLNLPPRICHNDTKISNILFQNEEAFCIIDLDTLQVGALWADFGDMVRTYTPTFDENEPDISKITMRLPYFEALANGFLYELQTVLTKEERETLILGARMLVFEQALRFLTDYLANDIYYTTQYEDHNLVRSKNQFALLQSIDNQLIGIEKILKKLT
jgi:Ser/Thr protein kinase RdoA (MazF antagonist)